MSALLRAVAKAHPEYFISLLGRFAGGYGCFPRLDRRAHFGK